MSSIFKGKVILVAVAAIQSLFFLCSIALPPKVNSDAANGMFVWQSMEQGSRWNCSIEPDPSNIALDRQEFMTWWSPGQYLVVGPLHGVGLGWGTAISVATWFCTLLGLFGSWRLFKTLGFDEVTRGVSILVLCFSWQITNSYGQFRGGDLPLFAALPWLIEAIVRLRPLSIASVIPFSLIYLAGAMIKLTFCVTGLAAISGILAIEFLEDAGVRRFLRVSLKGVLIFVCAHLVLWALFLRRGANPSGIDIAPFHWWYAVPAIMASPATSIVGLGSFIARIFLYPLRPLVNGPDALAPLFWLLAAICTFAYWTLFKAKPISSTYRYFMVGMTIVYISVLGGLIVFGAAISLEDRHFFPLGVMLLPGFVALGLGIAGRLWRIAIWSSLIFSIGYGAVALFIHAHQLRVIANVGSAGFTQHIITAKAMKALHALDDASYADGVKALVYVPSPEIAFEVHHARVMCTSDFESGAAYIRSRKMHGKVPLLVVLSNSALESGGRDEIVRRSFVDYPVTGWRTREFGDWKFYYQGTWPTEFGGKIIE